MTSESRAVQGKREAPENAAATILAVDDEPELLRLLAEILTAGGHQVRTAGSGEQALDAVAAGAPDLILLDVQMEGVDGLDVCQQLKAREETRAIPIILISGVTDAREGTRGMALGAADFISKPFRPAEILARVSIQLALREAGGTLGPKPAVLGQADDRHEPEGQQRLEVEDQLRRSLERIERSGEALLDSLEDHKRMEEALRQSEARSRALFEFAPDPLFLFGLDRRFSDVNRAAVEVYGYTREEFQTLRVEDIAALDRRASVPERVKEAAVQGAPFDWRHRRKDGSEFDVEIRFSPFDISGQAHLLASARDITARERAVAERRKLEDQLRAAQKMESLGSLAGGIAHDFNNLLSVILSYTAFATEGLSEDDPVREDLLEVKTSAERAAALTRQLLAFSRKQVLQPVPISLNQVATGFEPMLRRILGEDITFCLRLAPDLGLVLADPDQLSQVLMNLVVNARDSMPEGGNLTIETANVVFDETYVARHSNVKPGPHVQLAVTDTGRGMDEQTKARLFEPFFTTKEMGKGTGLGLSTVHGIITQSDGDIQVYSEPGQGTCLKISLPRGTSSCAAEVTESGKVEASTGGTETILVVEDEEALRRVASRTLVAGGYNVLLARDGQDALEISARTAGDIHLVMTDVIMPRVGGRALVKELLQRRPEVRVLYMSGYTNDTIVHHGVLDAGTRFIGKPFTATDLMHKVRQVLDDDVLHVADDREATIDPGSMGAAPALDREALGALPRGVARRLREAVVAARFDEMTDLIETFRDTNPDLAAGMRRMAESFDYSGLRVLLDGRKENDDGR